GRHLPVHVGADREAHPAPVGRDPAAEQGLGHAPGPRQPDHPRRVRRRDSLPHVAALGPFDSGTVVLSWFLLIPDSQFLILISHRRSVPRRSSPAPWFSG